MAVTARSPNRVNESIGEVYTATSPLLKFLKQSPPGLILAKSFLPIADAAMGRCPRSRLSPPRVRAAVEASALFLHAAGRQARPRANETRHDGDLTYGDPSIPSLLVPLAGLRPEDLAGELARQRRRALDDARSVPRPRPRTGACLLRLRHHRGFVDGALHVPGLARHLSALCRQHAQARSRRARLLSRPGHHASRPHPDPVGDRVPALPARPAGQLARPRDRGAHRVELCHQQQRWRGAELWPPATAAARRTL